MVFLVLYSAYTNGKSTQHVGKNDHLLHKLYLFIVTKKHSKVPTRQLITVENQPPPD